MVERIQRKRTKGWRMPEGAVYVGRPSRWGNPYLLTPDEHREWPYNEDERCTCVGCMTPSKAVDYYRADVTDQAGRRPADIEAWLAPLRGRDLACWCPLDQPCHADVLIELANAATGTAQVLGI